MTHRAWRYALASVSGTAHVKRGDPCQDSSACEIFKADSLGDVLIAVASDGAGSARLSQLGSLETCRLVTERLRSLLAAGLPVVALTREVATQIVLDARDNLRLLAESAGAPERELACTLIVAVVAQDAAAFFQVGDGFAIVGPRSEPIDEYCWVFWPEPGEYANMTRFLTDAQVENHLQHAALLCGIDEMALLTDGLQNLVLDLKERVPHAPFFSRMMAPLRSRPDHGRIDSLSAALATYLDSSPINERTDDDKTLVLASRRSLAAE